MRIVLPLSHRYSVNDDKDVTVLGIFHGALDICRYLPRPGKLVAAITEAERCRRT